jgi:hypothetical protein
VISDKSQIFYMLQERWQQINELFYVALERRAEQRSDFLAASCDGNDELRCEVE